MKWAGEILPVLKFSNKVLQNLRKELNRNRRYALLFYIKCQVIWQQKEAEEQQAKEENMGKVKGFFKALVFAAAFCTVSTLPCTSHACISSGCSACDIRQYLCCGRQDQYG